MNAAYVWWKLYCAVVGWCTCGLLIVQLIRSAEIPRAQRCDLENKIAMFFVVMPFAALATGHRERRGINRRNSCLQRTSWVRLPAISI